MLPFALEEALVYQGIGENADGQETVRTACEILSVLWQEVGAENFTEWVSRIYLLVQSKKVLQCSMSEQSEDKGTSGTSSQNIERSKAQSKCSLSSITLCGLWEGLQDRCSSPRWERVQQLTREFGEIVQKLPCEATHTPTILYCLRKTSKGLSALHTSLSTIQSMENKGASNPTENCGDSSESEGEREETAADVGTSIDSAIGVDIYNNKITGNKVTALTTNNTSTSTAPKVMTSINSASETLTPWDVQSNRIQSIDGKAATLYGGAGHGTHNGAVFDTRQIDTASGFKYRQGAKAGGIGWQNGKSPTLELSQNCAVYDMTHADEVMRPVMGDKSNCLNSRMGTGGNQVPVVHCLNDQGGKVMDVSAEKTGTLRAESHGHAPIVHSYCIAGNTIDRKPQNGGNGNGSQAELAYTLNTVDRHAVAYRKSGFGRWTEDKISETQRAAGGDLGGGSETLVVGSLCAHDGRGFNGQDVEQNKIVYPAGKVRRLTPTECERLMGLPDGYTDIDFKGKPAPDSKRYKAIGNGMAVPCSDFIMRRIAEVSNGQNEGHD
jgi:DNA (cytosine-5)-methyltransferase 1